jgi:hypothetical protein
MDWFYSLKKEGKKFLARWVGWVKKKCLEENKDKN